MASLLRNWRRRRALARAPIPDALWNRAVQAFPLSAGLSPPDRARLRVLATQFLEEKRFFGAHGLEITPEMALDIALEACLPILELGLDWYDQWTSIIVYADDFLPRHEVVDEWGVLHVDEAPYSGEAWERGPVVLSWGTLQRGESLAIHEFTHTLDMRNGSANGMPPLHRDMPPRDWTRIMTTAYDDLQRHADTRPFDPYAAQDPAEFFAVMSEYFFAHPRLLAEHYPEVYGQFRRFFRQDPLARMPWEGDITTGRTA
ncbi:hypothetical protein SAMN05421721_10190 [Ectothiorhodospira mobilis]|uniref:Zinc-dependent peptidase n=1 Tax=Ectothiorhodospira mobilis TaxID=195064 RepID=A0A1I4P9T1_ECTMO|nr:M90 family metallopeptidase [Ectothiorhodospira mobilis]SFM24370.1 hypothetical protein SAMN05421721_10190 [Ectothiorhodospira mobilis]